MTILYLHGFASAGHGEKAQALRQRFGAEQVLSPDLPVDPQEVRSTVDTLLRSCARRPTVLVGTSLGGFYACWFAMRWQLPCVLVNPSTAPSRTIGARPGRYRNHATGAELEVRPEFAEAWAAMEADAGSRPDGALISLFLAQDDDVLPCELALQRFADAAFVRVTPDGGHRYTAHWDSVMDRIATVCDAGRRSVA